MSATWQWAKANPDAAARRIRELERENAELETTLKLVYDANQRGIKAWQQAHPDKAMVWPDQAKLVEWLVRENAALRKAKDMVELERCEMMRTMSLLCNQAEQLQADKERLDWLGSQKDQPWLYWERPLRLTREAIDAFRKEAQP